MTDTAALQTESSLGNRLIDSPYHEQEFFQLLIDRASTPLFVLDNNHRIIVWNQALADLTGCPAEEMLGTSSHWMAFYASEQPTIADIVLDGNPELLAKYHDISGTNRHENGVITSSSWFLGLNGFCRYLHFEVAPVRGRNGDTIAVIETLHDITDRKRVEDSAKLFELAVEQSANSIVITDTLGDIYYVNRKFCEVTGYSKEEVMNRNPRVLKSGYQTNEYYQQLWQTISSGESWQGELHNKRKDGSLFWEQASITPIKDDEGDLVMYLGVKEDITKRKAAELQLQKQRAELLIKHEELKHVHSMVESAKLEWEETMDCIGDMVILADSSGAIIRCNRAVTTFTGISYKDLLNTNWQELLHSTGMTDISAAARQEIRHKETGRWFQLNIYSSSIRSNTSTIVTLNDLTETKTIHEELSAAYEQLKATHSQLLQQEKLASVGQLAAGIAHEINNPMGFISSNLKTLGKYTEKISNFLDKVDIFMNRLQDNALAAELQEAKKSFKINQVMDDLPQLLAESTEGADRVKTIVQNLKTFSRIDDSGAREVDLHECISSTVSIAWNEIKYMATLEKDFGEVPPVRCHAQQINQVLLNLLVNAAQSLKEQGTIRIKTWCETNMACIAVSDTGCGIPEHIVNRIFEPFFTTKEVGKGTGLGLSISYDIIKNHNGSIEVASEPGKGTTFTIRLPLENQQ